MFSGIIEDLGVVKKIEPGKFTIETRLTDLKVTDSIAVNGVCLTVSKVLSVTEGWTIFSVDVMEETLKKTNLGIVKPRNKVNLERAIKLGSRLGGHIVTGHINGVAKIKDVINRRNSQIFEVMVPPDILRYLVVKGSIAVDGVSLTVIDVFNNKPKDRQYPVVFTVSIVSTTAKNTTLGFKTTGDLVNIEVDILSKYVEKMLEGRTTKSNISEEFLKEKGFLKYTP